MPYSTAHLAYFSATGTTKTVVEAIGEALPGGKAVYDFLRNPLERETPFAATDLLVVGVPVYSGRVPAIALESVARLRGSGTPAIAVVVYGNREYEDALLELSQTLHANGFSVIGAGAFIAKHSIFPEVATARPDEEDMRCIASFAADCARKLDQTAGPEIHPVAVKGNFPYREVTPGGLKPTIDDTCTLCGACVALCPTKALRIRETLTRDNERCIACAACIDACPTGAQAFRGEAYEAFRKKFVAAFSARKEPEIFV